MKYIIKKVITLIMALLVISIFTFVAFSILPGDAAMTKLGTAGTPEKIEAMREELGLNRPIITRYLDWLKDAVKGEFGESYQYSSTSVASLISERLPTTVLLAVISFLFIFSLSIPLGLISTKHPGKWLDTLINQLMQIMMAIPSFFLGIILTYIFGLVLKWFQPGKFISPAEDFIASARYLVFPALAVALPKVAMMVKFLRSGILAETKKDYVRTAYSKGSSENRVLFRHILKNALIPVITFAAMIIAEILAGSIVVEQVFGVPGMGRLLIMAIASRDYPVVQAVVTYITAIVIIVNFIVDMLYQLVDPRVNTA